MPLTDYVVRPRFTLSDFAAPPAKSARETKTNFYNNQIAGGLASYGNEAYRLRDVEDANKASALENERAAAAKAAVPTITQQEIDRRFSRRSDAASQGFMDASQGIRDYAGDSGVGGGQVQGAFINAELARLGQLTQARGDLMSFKATQDALDRQKELDEQGRITGLLMQPPSMLGVDFENQKLQTWQNMAAVEANRQGAKAQAEATKSAGWMGLAGQGLGLIGSLL